MAKADLVGAEQWLSVIMPVHNGAHFLPATLESLVNEPIGGVEILILDSSPDDSCKAIAERFSDRLPIQYHARRDITPWPEKTNIGVEMARAPFVTMLHQDDLWLPGRSEAARLAINTMGDAALHIAPALLVDERGKRLGSWSPPLRGGIHSSADVMERLLVQNFIAIPSPLIRRSAWLAVGGMESDLWYTADWDLYLKLVRRWPMAVGARPTTAFRVHSGSLTMTGSRNAASLRNQLDIVVERHGGQTARPILRRARASVSVNCALAAAANGDGLAAIRAVATLLALGPLDLPRFLKDSRLVERLLPRARLWLAGTFG